MRKKFFSIHIHKSRPTTFYMFESKYVVLNNVFLLAKWNTELCADGTGLRQRWLSGGAACAVLVQAEM